jgi:lipid II:glycine glycyltransferase (peptidoglycan interpeptide bridge formation enzyme)
MKQRGRRGIKNSAKRGITVRRGSSKDVAKFYRLFKITGARQGLNYHGLEYYREVYRMFSEGDNTDVSLFISEHPEEGEPLASAMFIRLHEKVWYLYGASDDKRRSAMPQYPMQWEALKWSRSNGAKVFDWGGASTAPDDPSDMFANVWSFKKGLGATFHSSAGAWDKPLDTPKWRIFQLLNKGRKIFKR